MKVPALLLACSLLISQVVADTCQADWPAREGNRCWALHQESGERLDGYLIRLHIIPESRGTWKVTGRFEAPSNRSVITPRVLSGTAARDGDSILVGMDQTYLWKPVEPHAQVVQAERNPLVLLVDRSTLEGTLYNQGWTAKPVPCR